jgi:4-amino-4-deoxy-L-arabinose transferase-like glycosyltransferase
LLWLFVVTGGIPFKWTISRTYRAALPTAATLALFEVVASGNLVTGDEPHYLLVARSLQRDGDLDLANDYDVSRHRDFYPVPLTPRHTILTGRGREYSFHGLGVALLAFPGFVAGGIAGARLVFIIISALGVAATWKATRDLTDRNSAGTIAVVFLLCQLSFIAQGAAIYPDGPAAAITAGALLTLLRVEKSRPSAAWLYSCGAALTFLPWLHIRLTPVAIVFAVALVIAMRRRSHAPASYVALFAVPFRDGATMRTEVLIAGWPANALREWCWPRRMALSGKRPWNSRRPTASV